MIKIIGLFIILFFIGCQESSEKNKVEDIYGCMDSDAMNYDINATISNDSCIFNGCTDPEAINYNPFATIDDGNCLTEDFIPDGYSYYWNDEFNEDTLIENIGILRIGGLVHLIMNYNRILVNKAILLYKMDIYTFEHRKRLPSILVDQNILLEE